MRVQLTHSSGVGAVLDVDLSAHALSRLAYRLDCNVTRVALPTTTKLSRRACVTSPGGYAVVGALTLKEIARFLSEGFDVELLP